MQNISNTRLEHHLQNQAKSQSDFDQFFWHRVRWEAVSVAFSGTESFKLLDVGAGTGQVGRFLAQDNPRAEYFFIEPLVSLEENLVEQYGADRNFVGQKSYEEINFLTCLDVLEHIEDDKVFVEDIVEKMHRSARLIITVPALQMLWSPWDEAMGHFRRYDKKQLINLLKPLNLEINRCHYLFPEMIAPGLWRRATAGKIQSENGEFPNLKPLVNKFFYQLSNLTRKTGAINPLGSSLLIDVTKN